MNTKVLLLHKFYLSFHEDLKHIAHTAVHSHSVLFVWGFFLYVKISIYVMLYAYKESTVIFKFKKTKTCQIINLEFTMYQMFLKEVYFVQTVII